MASNIIPGEPLKTFDANSLEIKVIDAKKNRSLVVKRAFRKGDSLFTESPIVSAQFAWNKFYNYKACEFCMKPLESALENVRRLTESPGLSLPFAKECCPTNKNEHCVCSSCGVKYCSVTCRERALNAYHRTLCVGNSSAADSLDNPFNVLMDAWRQLHLPPETTTIELVVKLLALVKQAPNKGELVAKLANFESALVNQTEQIPHKLLDEQFFSQLEHLRAITLELFSSKLHTAECEPWLSEQGFRQLFSLIGRNSQGIGTSPFSVYVANTAAGKRGKLKNLTKPERRQLDKHIDKIYDKLETTAGQFLNAEGSGLYELQSMINHSCKPNAQIAFNHNNHLLSIVALEDLSPGEEVLISYLDECELSRSRHSRQKALRENYLFNCECERCLAESDQADETSDEELEEDDDDDDEEDDEDYEDEIDDEDITEDDVNSKKKAGDVNNNQTNAKSSDDAMEN